MFANLNGWHLLIILAVVLLLFGAPKLPGLARSVGQSMRIFRGEMKTMSTENADTAENAENTASAGGAVAADSVEHSGAAAEGDSTVTKVTPKSTTVKPKP